MAEVPAAVTPATPAELETALRAAGPDLTTHQLALLLAHIAIETRDGASLKQYNVGNLIVPRSREDDFDFWRPPWFAPPGPDASPRIKRLHSQMLEGRQPSAFRAFPQLEHGISAYLSRMRGRYSPMLRADGPWEFVREWRDTGYTPDLDVDATVPNFTRKFERFGGKPPTAGRGGWLALGGALLGLWWLKRSKNG